MAATVATNMVQALAQAGVRSVYGVVPPEASFTQAQGFSFYLLKEVQGGGAGNVVASLGSELR